MLTRPPDVDSRSRTAEQPCGVRPAQPQGQRLGSDSPPEALMPAVNALSTTACCFAFRAPISLLYHKRPRRLTTTSKASSRQPPPAQDTHLTKESKNNSD